MATNDYKRNRTAENLSKSVLESKKKQNIKDSQEIGPYEGQHQNLIEIKVLERFSNSTEKYKGIVGENNGTKLFE